MHYRIPGLPSIFDVLKTADDFSAGKNMEKIRRPVVNIEKDQLPKETRIKVLSSE